MLGVGGGRGRNRIEEQGVEYGGAHGARSRASAGSKNQK